MTLFDFVIRIVTATLLGFVIGLERQLTGHTAGIRTNVLVSMGACMFVMFAMVVQAGDVTRTAAQIVSGVGFICTGIIFKDSAKVRGINTAATIWCAAAVGVLSSSGEILYAASATALLIFANLAFRIIGMKVRPLRQFDEDETIYKISARCCEEKEFPIRSTIMRLTENTKFTLIHLESADIIGGQVEIEATFLCGGKRRDELAERTVGMISLQEGVQSAGWELAEG